VAQQTASFDVAVIGGGSGLTAASYALDDDRSVALIDSRPDALGGTCVNRGCIPTKGLIQAANTMAAVRDAARFGIDLDQTSVRADAARIFKQVRERRVEDAKGVRDWVESTMTPFFGAARFVGDKLIEMDDGRRLSADKIFIACGARPAVPPITGIDRIDYLTNESALELDDAPDSIVIVGGGYIGCEFGHFFASLGARVTIVDPSERRLLREDDDIGDLFTEAFGRRVALKLNARAAAAEPTDAGVELTIERPDGSTETVSAERLMLATGRASNAPGLDPAATGVDLDDKGWVVVDEHLRTSHADIYAYGDCIGSAMFKHTSSYEGKLAYDNAFGADRTVDYAANPHAVFSDPEIAAVGMTERQARDAGLDVRVAKASYADVAKGRIVGSPPSLAKLIVENGTDRIVGFHIAGPHAAILIHEVVVAMSAGLPAAAVRDAIHVHPSLPELVQHVFSEV
jgi:dihydrolipoamide dehydrogenase